MGREVSRRRDQHMSGCVGPFENRILAERGLDILDRMEVAIFAQQRVAKRGEKLVTRVRKSAPSKRAAAQTKSARARIKAAATSVRKAAEANIEAVSSAVDKATSEQAS